MAKMLFRYSDDFYRCGCQDCSIGKPKARKLRKQVRQREKHEWRKDWNL